MFVVSESAKRRLHESLVHSDKPGIDRKCFRIERTAHEQFLTLRLVEPAPQDATYAHEGRTVLALPRSLQTVCRDRRLRANDKGRLVLS
jgi:hypothetical protein